MIRPRGVVTVIQARTGSSRLPGKILLPLGHGTVLDVMIDRVRAARLAGTIVVATTTEAADDAIVTIARANGVACFRGHPTDLLDRHLRAARLHEAAYIVKIPSDCPLIDPAVIDQTIGEFLSRRHEIDYASNLHPPTHPDGNDVEIVALDALEAAHREARRDFEREHTTPFIWNQPDRFKTANLEWSHGDHSLSHRVVLDYAEDYALICAVYDALAPRDPLFTAADVVRFLDEHPAVHELNAMHRGYAWYHAHQDELAAPRPSPVAPRKPPVFHPPSPIAS